MDEVISLDNLFILGNNDVASNVKIAEKGIAMKILDTGEIKSLKKDDILRIELFRSTRNYAMRVITKNNTINLNNIEEEMVEEVKTNVGKWYSLSAYIKPLETRETTKGQINFSDDYLEYRNEKLIFDVPLKDITTVCNVKNEVVLGFDCDDQTEGVTEMRLTVPDENFVQNLRERSETGQSKSIITFEEMNNISPRGKSDYIFNQNYLRIIGRTFEHKILFSSIKRVIQFENEKNVYIIFEIDPSIKQGLTRYNFVNILFDKEIEEEFTIEQDENVQKKFPELPTSFHGELFKTFVSVLQIFTKRSVETSAYPKDKHNENYVSCNFRASESQIHFLDDGVMLLPKVMFIPFKKIRLVEFSRVDVSVLTSKSFDMKIITYGAAYPLTSIEKEQFGRLDSFFSKNNVELSVDVIENNIPEGDDDDDSTTDINDEMADESSSYSNNS